VTRTVSNQNRYCTKRLGDAGPERGLGQLVPILHQGKPVKFQGKVLMQWRYDRELLLRYLSRHRREWRPGADEVTQNLAIKNVPRGNARG
jgi:hypothetical protein